MFAPQQPQGRAADLLVDHRRRQGGCDLAAVLQHGLETVGQRERGPLALAAVGFRSLGGNGDGRQCRQGSGHLLLRAGLAQQLAELAVGQPRLGMFVLGALPLGNGQALREASQCAARLSLQGENPPVFAQRVGAVVLQPAGGPQCPPGGLRGPVQEHAALPDRVGRLLLGLAAERGGQPGEVRRHVGVHHSRAVGDGQGLGEAGLRLLVPAQGHQPHAIGQQDLGRALGVAALNLQGSLDDVFRHLAGGGKGPQIEADPGHLLVSQVQPGLVHAAGLL